MVFAGKEVAKSQILQMVEEAAMVAASSFGLAVWGIMLVGSGGRTVARIFIDSPWEGKVIPFVLPETRLEKSKKKSVHPMQAKAEDSVEKEDDALSDEGVTVDQCAKISHMIGIAMEVDDVFAEAWILEVSSPGLERQFFQLSQMECYIGHPVNITLEDAHPDFENRRKFSGTLKSVGEETFSIELDSSQNTLCTIEWDMVKKAQLVHIFPDTQLVKSN